MLDDKQFRQWTRAFSPGSYYKGDWSNRSKMIFLGPDPETGKEGGMVSRIAENRPYEYISIEHIGIIQNGIEDTTSETARNAEDEYEEVFNKMWPEG